MRTSKIVSILLGMVISGFFFGQASANSITTSSETTKTIMSEATYTFNTPKATSFCSQNYTGVIYKYKILIGTAKTDEQKKNYRNSLSTYIIRWKLLCTAKTGTGSTNKPISTTQTGITTTTKTLQSTQISSGSVSIDNSFFLETNTGILQKYSNSVLSQVATLTDQFKLDFKNILENMISNGLLTNLDRTTMKKKIVLYYVEDCKNLNGKTSVEQRVDPTTNKVTKTNFLGIVFKVNVCTDTSIYSFLKTALPEIITHELGHVYGFIHDKNTDVFGSICWTNGTRKTTCTRESFVSDYAMGDADEDYAETFTNRYRFTLPSTTNTQLLSKIRYFNGIQQR